MPVSEQVYAKAERIRSLAAARGVHNVRLFGSAARGEARPDSDLDLLVDVEPGHGLLDLAALARELQELLGRKIDLTIARRLKPEVREAVLAEAEPL